jgi:hypothetical protein
MLYHVTTEAKAGAIRRRGKMVAGHVMSEMGGSREAETREEFNRLLGRFRPEGRPGHTKSLFFWPDLDKAQYIKRQMEERNPSERYVVLAVDSAKVPCQCFAGDANMVNKLYEVLYELRPSEYEPPLEEEEEREKEEEAEKLAKDYYRRMRKYPDGDFTGMEILCPCDVPAKVITVVRGGR